MDETLEKQMYALIAERLPHAAVTSIAHHPVLAAFHQRQLRLEPGADGMRLVAG